MAPPPTGVATWTLPGASLSTLRLAPHSRIPGPAGASAAPPLPLQVLPESRCSGSLWPARSPWTTMSLR
eukprot:14311181-Alexandrium_andersonii.AAC.1